MNLLLSLRAIEQSLDLDSMASRHTAIIDTPWGLVALAVPEGFVNEIVQRRAKGEDVLDMRVVERTDEMPRPVAPAPATLSRPQAAVPKLSPEQRARAAGILGHSVEELEDYPDDEIIEAIQEMARREEARQEARSEGVPEEDDEDVEREFSATAPGGTFSVGSLLTDTTPDEGEEEAPPAKRAEQIPTPEQAAQARAPKNPAKARAEKMRANARKAPAPRTVPHDDRGYPVVEQNRGQDSGDEDDLFPSA